jgi:hypothetical protein
VTTGIVVAVALVALAIGLWVAAVEEGADLHRLAWLLAQKASGAARRMSLSLSLAPEAIGARIVAMCRVEIAELSRAAAHAPSTVRDQEQRLRDACYEVASKVAVDTRAG